MLQRADFVLIFQLIFMAMCLFFTISSWKVLKPEGNFFKLLKNMTFLDMTLSNLIVLEVIEFKSVSSRDDMGFETVLPKSRSHLFEDDNLASRASLPSSVICSLNSIAKQPSWGGILIFTQADISKLLVYSLHYFCRNKHKHIGFHLWASVQLTNPIQYFFKLLLRYKIALTIQSYYLPSSLLQR